MSLGGKAGRLEWGGPLLLQASDYLSVLLILKISLIEGLCRCAEVLKIGKRLQIG
jgi:hypothetical protein